jgi:multiple sugar transport system substrate-binding protein
LYNAKKLTRDVNGDGVIDEYGFGMRGAGYAAVYYATYPIYGWGGSVFKDDEVTINEPEAVEGFTWYINLFKEHKVCPPSVPTDAWRGIVEGFGGGRTSMYIHNTGSFGEQVKYLGLEKFSVAHFPITSKTGIRWPNFVGAEIFYIPKKAKYKDEAWEFVKFFSEKKQSIKYNLGITSIPPRKSFAESNEYKGQMPKQFWAFIEQLNYSMSNPYLKYPAVSAAVQTKFESYLQAALLGKLTPKEALDKMAEDIKQALKQK